MKEKISVITVTYNEKENLKRTLDALAKQDYPNVESIIVDGNSNDGSLDVIKEFEKNFKGTVKWISEKDSGMDEAINKGLKMATGDIIGCYWDEFANEKVLSRIAKEFDNKKIDGIHGDLVYMTDDIPVRYWKVGEGEIKTGWMPAHPTLYLRTAVYEKYGFYRQDIKYAWDYEFMIRIFKDNGVKLSYIPEVLINMFYGGTTTGGIKSYLKSFEDSVKALKVNDVRWPLIITIKRTIKTLFQFKNINKLNS